MYSNSIGPAWYGDVASGPANNRAPMWRPDVVHPPGLSKPVGGEGKRGVPPGPPGFFYDSERHQRFPSQHRPPPHGQPQGRDVQRPHHRSHSARRARYQDGPQQAQSSYQQGNQNPVHNRRQTPNRRHLTPGPTRSTQHISHLDLSSSPVQPFTPPTAAIRAPLPLPPSAASSSSTALTHSPEQSSSTSAPLLAPARVSEPKPISAALASRLLDQATKTSTQVVDNLNVTEQMADKYHILQSEDGRTILFKKTPRGRRGGVKHRRKQLQGGEGILEGSDGAGSSSHTDIASCADSLPAPALAQDKASKQADAASADSAATAVASPSDSSEPQLHTPPQQAPPRVTQSNDWTPAVATADTEKPAPAAAAVTSTSATAKAPARDAALPVGGMDDIMQELAELRAAKARAEEAQEQLTQQAQLLLQEKSQLVQQMAQKEKVIKNLEERLEYVQAECEDLRLATPNSLLASLQEELNGDDADSNVSAELHLLQALLSGAGDGGSQGMGAEGAAAVAAAIAQGQDGYYILDTRAAKPMDALQYINEQQASSLLTRAATT